MSCFRSSARSMSGPRSRWSGVQVPPGAPFDPAFSGAFGFAFSLAADPFLSVAELSSFTRAAEHLGLSKARVSTAVQALEAQVGSRLLQRSTRAVRLTPNGEEFLARARQLVSDAEELASLFQAPSSLRGRVRVDMPQALARSMFIPRLPELAGRLRRRSRAILCHDGEHRRIRIRNRGGPLDVLSCHRIAPDHLDRVRALPARHRDDSKELPGFGHSCLRLPSAALKRQLQRGVEIRFPALASSLAPTVRP